jgi:membrane protease YdiL (CAAX protease family)
MKTIGKISLFFVITFVFTILLAIVQQALGLDTAQISLPQFGPALAALVMLRIFRKDEMELTLTFKGVQPRKYLAAIGIPLIVPVILFFIYSQFVTPISVPPIEATAFIMMLGGILLGAFGEELGWRGYAQNLLEKQLNGVVGFLLVGLFWGAWHIGNFQNGPIFMLFFVFSTIGYSAVMGWLVQGTNYNVVLPTLFHFSVNVGFFILQDVVTDVRIAALNGLVWIGAAALIVARNRKAFLPTDSQQKKQPIVPEYHQSSATIPGA